MKGHWRMNNKYLMEVKEKIKIFWNSCEPSLSIFKKLKEVIRFYKEYCKHKVEDFVRNKRS
jgi:chloramphenicol O-acetyltransferase